MKTLTIILCILISGNAMSQELKYTDIITGIKPEGPWTSYLSKDGTIYNVGDTITIGNPSSNGYFNYVSAGSHGVKADFRNSRLRINHVKLGGLKDKGYYAKLIGWSGVAMYGTPIIIQIENAIDTKEVKSSRLSEDDALNELKKAKDKLDLGLISQDKYDSIKIVLGKFIKP
jgi:hypothetical protein